MSCILYSKSSYDYLAKNPLFRHICQRDLNVNPVEVACTWWSLNVRAYKRRYNEEVDSVALSLEGGEPEFEFKERLTGKYTDLYKLMGRIDYQLVDGEFEKTDDADLYQKFLDFREYVADKAIERLGPLEPVQIPNNAISLMDMIQTGKGKR
jgi:hypothetical protein